MRFAGLVLAGGRSSRMGHDKAALVHRGRTLLDHMEATLRAAGATHVIVSGDRAGGVPDRRPGLGPVGGIEACLPELDDGLVLVVPVDMPRLDPVLLGRLADAAALTRSARFEGHPLPWAFRVDGAARNAVAAVVPADDRGRSLRELQMRLATVSLAMPAGGEAGFVNVNTPADWEALGP
ncbi:molybdenum cofactor guanylyltransferase [Lysobacter humi (ex Lee et al. 2017)]